VAWLFEKKDGYFITTPTSCKRADQIDKYVLELRM
jgi:hypothetical protein